MKVTKEISLADFEAWSGARDTLDALIENGYVDDAEAEIEECFPDGIDETSLNDYLWFDVPENHPEWIAEESEEDEEDGEEGEEGEEGEDA